MWKASIRPRQAFAETTALHPDMPKLAAPAGRAAHGRIPLGAASRGAGAGQEASEGRIPRRHGADASASTLAACTVVAIALGALPALELLPMPRKTRNSIRNKVTAKRRRGKAYPTYFDIMAWVALRRRSNPLPLAWLSLPDMTGPVSQSSSAVLLVVE